MLALDSGSQQLHSKPNILCTHTAAVLKRAETGGLLWLLPPSLAKKIPGSGSEKDPASKEHGESDRAGHCVPSICMHARAHKLSPSTPGPL